MDSAFPGNSHQRQVAPVKKDVEKAPEKNVAKVVSGEVVRRKQPIGKRLKTAFLGGDSQSVSDYVLGDVVVPAIKDMFLEAVNGGMERLILGDNARTGRRGGRYSSRGQFDYNGISKGPMQHPRGHDPRQQLSRRARTMHVFDEVVFPSRADAEAVLTEMFTILDQFDVVTVSEFYELAGISGNFTDQRFGWTDLRTVRPVRVRGGDYILDMPPTEPID